MVDAGQGDMLPAERREVSQLLFGNLFSTLGEPLHRQREICCVVKGNGRGKQGEPSGAVHLILIGAVPGLTETVEEDSSSECVACLALV